MPRGTDFVAAAMRYAGLPYRFGAEARLGDDSMPSALDCSELVQVALDDLGIAWVDGSWNQKARAIEIPLSQAIDTPGALLFFPGHVAISRGDGTTIEARGRAYGVGIFPARGRGFKTGGLVPELDYSPAPPPPPPVFTGRDRLHPGELLTPSQFIASANGAYSLVLQTDGNLVLYTGAGAALWASGTDGRAVGFAIMQTDGNLVVYAPDLTPLWASNTHGNEGTTLVLQDDGNLVLYGPHGALWATGTDGGRPAAPAAPPASQKPSLVRNLRRGSSGADVRVLQRRLLELGYKLGSADGAFGPRTEDAVRRFQADRGLAVDGIVGPRTWSALW